MWYWVFRAMFWMLLKVFFHYRVEGLKNLPQKTNFIVVANHASFLDSVAVGVAIPHKIYWMASRVLHSISWLRWFLRKANTFHAGGSTTQALHFLAHYQNVGIFPEGRCSRDGTLGEFRRGAALLAFKTGRPIVPCAIQGAHAALPFQAKFPKLFSPITVRIGKPIYLLKEFDDRINEVYLQEGTVQLRDMIGHMLYERSSHVGK